MSGDRFNRSWTAAVIAVCLCLCAAGQDASQSRPAEALRAEASQLEAAHQWEKAIEIYHRELELHRRTGDRAEQAFVLNRIGSAYDSLSKYKEAIATFEQAFDIVRALGIRPGEAAILDNLGSAWASLGDCDRASSYYRSALAVQTALGNAAGIAGVTSNLATCEVETGHIDNAIALFESALELRRKAGQPEREAPILNNLAAVYVLLGEYRKALDFHQQALALRRRMADRRGEGESLMNIGSAYRGLGQLDDALRHYEQGRAILAEVRDHRAEAVALERIGSLYAERSDYEKAVDNLERALPLARAASDRRNQSAVLNALGTVHHLLGDHRRALAFFNQALPLSAAIADRSGQADLQLNIGATYDATGQTAPAIAAYRAALGLYRELRMPQGEAVALNNLGRALLVAGNRPEAETNLRQALEIETRIADPRNQSYTAALLGRVSRESGKPAESRDFSMRALSLAQQVGDPRAEAAALQQLALTARAAGQVRPAVFYAKLAVNTVQGIRSRNRGLSQDLRESYARRNQEVYRLLASLLIEQGRLPEAQQATNLLKQEEYVEFTRRDANRPAGLAGRADLTSEESAWAARYREASERLVGAGARYSELTARRQRTAQEDQELVRIEKDLEAGNQAFRRVLDELARQLPSKSPAAGLPLKDIEAFGSDLADLPEGTVAIYTIAGDEKLQTILVTPNVRRAYAYPIPSADLNRKIATFREAVQNPSSDPKPLAAELYRMLIVPALASDLEQAHARTLMFSLDGALRYIPLAALYDGRRYLIEKYRLEVFTPASAARLKDEPKADWRLAGFGVTRAFGDFPALPNVAAELSGIVERDAIPGDVLLDDQFSQSALVDRLRRGYSVVHIATHFNFAPGDESRSFLLLGDGRRLTLAELDAMVNPFRGVDLLTLSACNTGVGDGRELEGLGVIAQRKGAKAVVATLWPVADDSTSEFMRAFYRLRQSEPRLAKAEALRQAQLRLLKGEARPAEPSAARGVRRTSADAPVKPRDWSHPYYWAPFFLMGNWL
ncbi:MAG: tetratricopeptide repeat protein [Acidobacteria bacterium]|nr:tetratricopeptide repeat protein [Acidobacteriota bacterium]